MFVSFLWKYNKFIDDRKTWLRLENYWKKRDSGKITNSMRQTQPKRLDESFTDYFCRSLRNLLYGRTKEDRNARNVLPTYDKFDDTRHLFTDSGYQSGSLIYSDEQWFTSRAHATVRTPQRTMNGGSTVR